MDTGYTENSASSVIRLKLKIVRHLVDNPIYYYYVLRYGTCCGGSFAQAKQISIPLLYGAIVFSLLMLHES